MWRIGIDVGGTFTDLAAVDEAGRVVIAKCASTPRDQSEGLMEGLGLLAAECGTDLDGLLQQGIAEGVFADRPIPVLLYGAQSTLVGAVRMLGSECLGAADPEEYIAEITRFVLAGLMFQDQVPESAGAQEPAGQGAA